MSKKVNTTIRIKCETPESASALFSYIDQYSSEINKAIKQSLAQGGVGVTDPNFENKDYDSLKMDFVIKPRDKGDVFVLNENNEITVDNYKGVEDKELYAIIESGKLIMYVRVKDEGEFDMPLGFAPSLAQLEDAFSNSAEIAEQVEAQLEKKRQAQESQKKQMKELKARYEEQSAPMEPAVADAEVIEEEKSPEETQDNEAEEDLGESKREGKVIKMHAEEGKLNNDK